MSQYIKDEFMFTLNDASGMSKLNVDPVTPKDPHYVTSKNLGAAMVDSKYIDSIPAGMETQKTKTGAGEPITLKIKQSRQAALREDGTVMKSYRLLPAFVELNMESAVSWERGVGGGNSWTWEWERKLGVRVGLPSETVTPSSIQH